MMMNNMNNRFKTAMCKHYEQSTPFKTLSILTLLDGSCHMGTKCHFAHGKEELRAMNEV